MRFSWLQICDWCAPDYCLAKTALVAEMGIPLFGSMNVARVVPPRMPSILLAEAETGRFLSSSSLNH
ncbi:MAG: hypothetical protein H7335_22990 [Massilia sp.]|nr:hypothetical protein [Massilia sp.]